MRALARTTPRGCVLSIYASDPEDALVPLFAAEPNNGTLQHVGTGIFMEFMQQPFLFTAAHVTDTLEQSPLLVPGHAGIDPIEGYVGYIDLLPEQQREDDPADVAYYRLSTQCSRSLCAFFRPLPQSRCQLVTNALKLGVCSVYGYPASKLKKVARVYRSEAAAYRGVAASADVYKAEGLDPESNIIVHFHKKRAVDRQTGKAINPIAHRGVSGGGIFAWPLGYELSEDWSTPELVGIFHSYDETKGLMIGTPLWVVALAVQLGQMKDFGGVR